MSDRVGTALVVISAVGFGTLAILGKLAADAGLSIPTLLFFRFLLATALGLALTGVVLIAGVNPAGADPRGIVIVLLAAVVYASYITASRVALDTVSADRLTAHVLPAAACAYFVYGSVTGTLSVPESSTQWVIIAAIAALATALPIFTFFAGLHRIGASRASIVSTIEPVVTLLLGAAILTEPMTPVTVGGGALVLAGVLLVQAD